MKILILAIVASIGLLCGAARGAVTYFTTSPDPSLPIGALSNPYASISLEGGSAMLIVGSINSLPTSLSIVELLGDGSSREIYAVTSSPIVEAFQEQFGFPGGTSATYHGGFTFSATELEALDAGSVALFSTHSDGSRQTQVFTVQTIPEPSSILMVIAAAPIVALQRTRKRTRRRS